MKTTDVAAQKKSIDWLESSPPFKELCETYPSEWKVVERELAVVFSSGKVDDVQGYFKRLAAATRRRDASETISSEKLILNLVRYRMADAVLRRHFVSVATGIENGTVRFNLLNGLVAQKLLFSHDLVRKPVSMFWFRLIWPFIRQKKFLMPLVQPKGIYCFYSRDLIESLARLIGSRTCIEIAAGDGTLASFLCQQGVQVTATDDYSWSHAVTYPEDVIKRDAKEALSLYAPEVVICSWPPSQNSFERQVFRTRSVQLYIVVGSRHKFAAGNWSDYEEQTSFSFQEARALSALVLPPELDAAVYLFQRK